MDIETIRDYCLAKKGTTEGFPFGEDFLVFKVMGKMTACIKLECPDLITLKCDPDYALELRDHYPGVEGAYHFNKKILESSITERRYRRQNDSTFNRSFIRRSHQEIHP